MKKEMWRGVKKVKIKTGKSGMQYLQRYRIRGIWLR